MGPEGVNRGNSDRTWGRDGVAGEPEGRTRAPAHALPMPRVDAEGSSPEDRTAAQQSARGSARRRWRPRRAFAGGAGGEALGVLPHATAQGAARLRGRRLSPDGRLN